jgi:hypothetical protein
MEPNRHAIGQGSATPGLSPSRSDSNYEKILDIATAHEPTSIEPTDKTRLSKVVTGTTLYSVFNWLYDYPLYSVVLWHFGIIWGGVLMILLSIPTDYLTLRFYDWSQQDWFAIEYLKSMKEYRGNNVFKRLLGAILRSTPVPVQVAVLSTKFNSFVVTTLMRDGAYTFKGLTSRDWKIFWGSNLAGQLYWILIIGGGIEIGKSVLTSLNDMM